MRSYLLATTAMTAAVISSALPQAALAQSTVQPDSWVDELIITGTRDSFTATTAATATRTPTPIEKVPQSVQTLTRTLIEEQDQQNISSALVNVSGVTPSSTMQIVLQPAMVRGFAVNYYFDGMPTYHLPAGVADPATLINIERIEVAKGPTSTLYGGGGGAPLSGIVNLVSSDPKSMFGGSVAIRGGSFSTLGGEGEVNIPLGESAGFRLAGMTEQADSYIDTLDSRRSALFPTLSFNLSDKTHVVIRGRYTHLEQLEYAGVPAELTFAPALIIDPYQFAGAADAPRTEVENKQLTASFRHELSERVQINAAVSHYDGAFKEYSAFPYGLIGGTVHNFGTAYLPSDTQETFGAVSVLARLGGERVSHQLLAGIDVDDTKYFGAMYFNPTWAVLDYALPNPVAPYGGVPPFFFDQNDRLRSTAVFVQDQISIGDRLDITAGLRWTDLRIRSNVGVVTDDTDKRVTPRIGATYKVRDGLSIFAGYAEGFKGIVGGGFYSITPEPETSQAYEAGLKLYSPINGLSGTIAMYRITRQNVVTADPVNPFLSIQTGEQRAQGFEADLVYEPSAALSVLFNYAYTDAEVTEDNTLPVGDRLRSVPRHSGRIAARYRFLDGQLKGLELGGGLTVTSGRELTLPNTIEVDGMALLDAQASYDFGRTTLSMSIVNLADERGFEPYQYFGGAYVSPTQPRSAYVTLRTRF